MVKICFEFTGTCFLSCSNMDFLVNFRFWLVWLELRKSKALSSLNFLQRNEKYQIGSCSQLFYAQESIFTIFFQNNIGSQYSYRGFWVPHTLLNGQFECSVHILRGPWLKVALSQKNFHFGSNLQKKVQNHYHKHIFFMWIVPRLMIWHLFLRF